MRTKGQGIAPPHHFLCGLCRDSRPTLGRKVRPVRGMRAYVCAKCAEKKA
mgnify:CR=1 FL=1